MSISALGNPSESTNGESMVAPAFDVRIEAWRWSWASMFSFWSIRTRAVSAGDAIVAFDSFKLESRASKSGPTLPYK
jgi:hypothetical protein